MEVKLILIGEKTNQHEETTRKGKMIDAMGTDGRKRIYFKTISAINRHVNENRFILLEIEDVGVYSINTELIKRIEY